jgi:hypothetical protein
MSSFDEKFEQIENPDWNISDTFFVTKVLPNPSWIFQAIV